MAKMSRRKIREALIQQLEQKGTKGSHLIDMVDDYMCFWDIKNNLIQNIKENGEMVEWKNGEKQKGTKKNDAIVELPKINRQMLTILKTLGLEPVENSDYEADV